MNENRLPDLSQYLNIIDNDNNTEIDDQHYEIKARVCKRLSKELGINDIQRYDENTLVMYEPPKEPGIHNCNAIIPVYYHLHKHPSKILHIDYFEIIKDDIRNFRELNKYQLEYIQDLSHEQKNELFMIFNDCIASIRGWFEE
jgi:hypothetical protein